MPFDLNRPLRRIHIELTDKCNALCPQCYRTDIKQMKAYPGIGNSELTLQDFEKYIPGEIFDKCQYIMLCGAMGDPMLVKDLIPIIKFIRKYTDKEIEIFSNASLRDLDFWNELGSIPNIEMIFALDGLKDTHHLYRVNTDFDRVVERIKAYTSAGGKAGVQTIAFGHNQHQIQEIKKLCDELGVAKHAVLRNTRFGDNSSIDYSFKGSKIRLEPPDDHDLKYQLYKPTDISCKFIKQNSIYVTSSGMVVNCGWLGGRLHRYMCNGSSGEKHLDKILNSVNLVHNDMRQTNLLDIPYRDELYPELAKHWGHRQPEICTSKCGFEQTNRFSGGVNRTFD